MVVSSLFELIMSATTLIAIIIPNPVKNPITAIDLLKGEDLILRLNKEWNQTLYELIVRK